MRSYITRVEVEVIVYRSCTGRVNVVNPTKLDRYTIVSRSTRSSTRSIHDRFPSASRPLSYSISTRVFLTCQKPSHDLFFRKTIPRPCATTGDRGVTTSRSSFDFMRSTATKPRSEIATQSSGKISW